MFKSSSPQPGFTDEQTVLAVVWSDADLQSMWGFFRNIRDVEGIKSRVLNASIDRWIGQQEGKDEL